MLIDEFKEPCELLNQIRRPDGEGGFFTEYVPAGEFMAAIIHDASALAMIAEKQGVSASYTVTTDKNVLLKYPDVIRRLSDGKVFRITTDGRDTKAPVSSSIQINQVKAERWELTNE